VRTDSVEILKRMFLTNAVEFGDFTLSSGKKTDVYVNSKNVMFRSDGISLIGRLIYENTFDLNFSSIGGMETGAIPIVTSTLNYYHKSGKKMNGFFVRKNTKKHGKKSRIEGKISPDENVVIVEDVTTTGESTLDAITEVMKVGGIVVRVISICDRNEGSAKALAGFDFRPIFKLCDLELDSLPR